jgi:hypothetical protein
MRTLAMLVLVTAALAACGESKPPERTVFDPQVQALKKARGVEGQMQEDAERRREQVERAEQAAPGY